MPLERPILGAFGHPREGDHMLGPIQRLDAPMRRFAPGEEVDVVIVGVGAAGGVLLQRLARAGARVIGFEAGPFWDTERDWVSDESGSHELYWTEPRVTGGSHPLALGSNNSGRGVGGGTVHWAAFTPRLHPSDFRVYTEDGTGVDWPMSYEDLKPYYELMERELPVSGPPWFPWGIRTATRTRLTRWGASATCSSAAAPGSGSASARAAPSPSSPGRTATGRTVSTGASASRGARWARSRARW